MENIALPSGAKVLGAELPERRLHTVASLAKEQGLDPRTLSNVLVAAGLIPIEAPAHHPIPAACGRDVAARVKRTVHVASLWKDMEFSRPIVDQLFDERLLNPIYYGRPGARGRTQKAVDRDELATFVAKLHATATRADPVADDLVPISKAAEKAKVPAVTVVHMVLGGFLDRVFRVPGDGVAALRVDPTEVKRHSAYCTRGLSPAEAFGSLKIPREVGWCLADRFPLEVNLAVDWIACPRRDHQIPRFDQATVSSFMARFIHPARLAEQHDLQVGEVVSRLKGLGVKPALCRAEIGVDFFRAGDLMEDLRR